MVFNVQHVLPPRPKQCVNKDDCIRRYVKKKVGLLSKCIHIVIK